MFASLPMYDRPSTRAAHDVLWHLIRDRLRDLGIDAPEALDRATPHMEGWARPDLLIGQICNLPYRACFRDRVTPIGAAEYGLPETPAGHYRSVWIVRADDPARSLADCAGYRFAFNEGLSNSGWGTPILQALDLGLALRPVLRTGAHAASLAAVVAGRADLAALDAITLGLLHRDTPEASGIRVLDRTPATPGMTFITAPGRDPAPLHAAIAGAIAALPREAAETLGLRAIVPLPGSAYDLPLPPPPPEHLPE